jgi:hypothetical protein
VYEVDGGEWLDFVSADLKHLSPRPERVSNGAAAATPQAEAEPAPPEVPQIVLVASAPEPIHVAEARVETAVAEPSPGYEPDQERRDKFFSRLSRWAKKDA